MSKNPSVNNNAAITTEDLRSVARLDETWTEMIARKGLSEKDSIEITGSYPMSLDDVEAFMKNIVDRHITCRQFSDEWIDALYCEPERDKALGFDKDERVNYTDYPGDRIPMTEEDMINEIFYKYLLFIDDNSIVIDTDDPLTDIFPFKEIHDSIRYFREDRNKPLNQRRFTDKEKEIFLMFSSDEEGFTNLSEEEKQLYYCCLDYLCEKDNDLALRIKAETTYGGSAQFPCDWKISRDTFLKLFKKNPQPETAVYLGKIYYFGWADDNKPLYNEALKYFSYGAVYENDEAIYMLGDMFMNGHGIKKDLGRAGWLYNKAYDYTKKQFSNGNFESNFADSAFRMARYSKDADDGSDEVYRYYLEAKEAINKRMIYNRFGDKELCKIIYQETSEAAEKYHALVKNKRICRFYSLDKIMQFINKSGSIIYVKKTKLDDNRVKLSFTAIIMEDGIIPLPGMILLTVPEADFCSNLREVDIELSNVTKCNIVGNKDYFFCNSVVIETDGLNGYSFMYYGVKVAKIVAEFFDWKVPGEENSFIGYDENLVKLLYSDNLQVKNNEL